MAELVIRPQVYARATPRLQALVRDLIVQGALLLVTFVLASLFAHGAALSIVVPVGLAAFLLYEPLLITLRGATIGQRMMNLRIVRARDLGRVSFPRALLRTFVKVMPLLVPAFIVMYFTARHRTLHDLAAGTVVIPYDDAAARPGWFAPPRWDEDAYIFPPPLWRFVVTLLYWIGFVIIWASLVPVLVSDCFATGGIPCTAGARLLLWFLALNLWIGFIAITVAGANGSLWGARRRLRLDTPDTISTM